MKKTQAVSELDLAVKRELVCQALLLSKPAPQSKVLKLRKKWKSESGRFVPDVIPLDDSGQWVLPVKQTSLEAVRPDSVVDNCPALESLDFSELAAPMVLEYSHAHMAMYRCWRRSTALSQDTLGQAQFLKLLDRCGGIIGAGELFPDKVAAQLWLTRIWREAAEGNFGLSLPQFVDLASELGRLLLGGKPMLPASAASAALSQDEDDDNPSKMAGLLEIVSRGLCGSLE
eukprot:TRINITY_DN55025_c0_g1_i1.p1 TRINITY_DN55025_c0_g1~~TRINITY_DN55025_c0_g1_i1.p1  ORF type:complete len:230 (-),score=46.12 TRINITY_DN55025_c0_g1_i1:29-718(-)